MKSEPWSHVIHHNDQLKKLTSHFYYYYYSVVYSVYLMAGNGSNKKSVENIFSWIIKQCCCYWLTGRLLDQISGYKCSCNFYDKDYQQQIHLQCFPTNYTCQRQSLWRTLLPIKIVFLFYFHEFVFFCYLFFVSNYYMWCMPYSGLAVLYQSFDVYFVFLKISSAEVLVVCLLSSFQLSALSFNRMYLKQKLNQGYCYYKVYLAKVFWKSTIWLMSHLIRRLIKFS